MSSVALSDMSTEDDATAALEVSIVGAVVSIMMSSLYVFVVSATPLKRTYTTFV